MPRREHQHGNLSRNRGRSIVHNDSKFSPPRHWLFFLYAKEESRSEVDKCKKLKPKPWHIITLVLTPSNQLEHNQNVVKRKIPVIVIISK
jgi:hypothetical protein